MTSKALTSRLTNVADLIKV